MNLFPEKIDMHKWLILSYIPYPHHQEYIRHVHFIEKYVDGFDPYKILSLIHFQNKIFPFINTSFNDI